MNNKIFHALIIIIAVIFLLMLTEIKVEAQPITEPINYGDVDENGVIEFNDFLKLNRYLCGNINFDEETLKRADVNGNGRVGSTDLELIREYLRGNIPGNTLPYNQITNYDFLYTDYEYSLDIYNNSATITKYKGTETTVNIPEAIDDVPVTKIGIRAFGQNNNLKTIFIPNTVIKIGERAFEDCVELEDIRLSEKLQYIERFAFKGCKKIREIILPESLITTDEFIFSGCEQLRLINIKSINTNNYHNYTFGDGDSHHGVRYNTNLTLKCAKYSEIYNRFANFINCESDGRVCLNEMPIIKRYNLHNPYTGKEIKLDFDLQDGNYKLVEGVDYTTEYINNINVGTNAQLIIKGKNQYLGIKTIYFYIDNANIKNILSINTQSQIYTGKEIKIPIDTNYEDYILEENKDYVINYENNIDIGTANITINGIGNFTGSFSDTFEIVSERNIANYRFAGVPTQATFNGFQITPTILIYDGNYILKENIDIVYEYENNGKVGLATVTVKGIGNYCGEKSFDFNILPYNIMNSIDYTEFSNKEYSNKEIEIPVNLKMLRTNYTLRENIDYIVRYNNNVDVGEATVVIQGIKNFTGTIIRQFRIIPKDFSKLYISVDTSNKIYTGKEIETGIILKDGDTTLELDKDYTVSYTNNINQGIAAVSVEGKGNYTGKIERFFLITTNNLSSLTATINTNNKTYTGKAIKTSIILKNGDLVLKEGTDYTVTYKNNKNTGKATVIVKVKGNYTGTIITKTFNIIPKKATLSSVENNKKKSAKVTWKKDAQATGYELYMSTSKNGKYAKIKTVTKNKITNYTKSKLKKKRTYYFKVRSYKIINGKKAYGGYSTVKNVKIKK